MNGQIEPNQSNPLQILDITESNRETHLARRASKSSLRRFETAPGTRISSFRVQGPDQPGMTAKFTDMLAKVGLNIERLETTVTINDAG